MKASLSLEYIGAANWDRAFAFERFERLLGIRRPSEFKHPFERPGPCVLRYYRNTDGDIRYEIIYGNRDYSQANSKGTRGVMVNYILQENELYHIKAPVSWRGVSIYFAGVSPNGDVIKITEEDATEWLNAI